jgi:basic membrane protein A and related proteins
MTLFDERVDVVSFHTASTAVMAAAQERGKMAVAYHSDMRSVAPDAQIAAVTHHWGDYYVRRVQAVLDGTWTSGSFWGGVAQAMVRCGDFGPKVPKPVREEVLARQSDIARGTLRPFTGPIKDNQGKLVLAKGRALSDEQILAMNYLVEGVQGTLPR